MFDLEKFKTGEYYVHLPTQEIYDDVMEFLDDNDFKWITGNKMNYENLWLFEKENTTISYDDTVEGVYRSNILFQKQSKDRQELSIKSNKQDKLKEIDLTDTSIMADEFEEMSIDEIVQMNNSIPNSNVEFIKSIDLDEEGDDLVKSPNHYIGDYGLEVEEVLRNFIPRYEDAYVAHRVASAIEYLLRSPLKNGTQDLEKARYNIGQALEHIEGESK